MESKDIKILAIDDHKDNLVSLKALVTEAFPQAVFLSEESGQRGIESARFNEPDVVLLDIVMPGIDGYEVCKKLKKDKQLSDIPVVFITALKGDKESRIKALEAGGDGFLAKPVDESELTAQIRAMLKIREATRRKKDDREKLKELVAERTNELQTNYALLQESNKKYEELSTLMRLMADNMPDMLWAKNLNKEYIFANKAICDNLLGAADTEEPLGKTDMFFALRERAKHQKDRRNAQTRGGHAEEHPLRRDAARRR